MTPAELRKLIEGATALPWREWDGGIVSPDCPDDGNVVCLQPETIMGASLARWGVNAALIVAAVNSLPGLLDEIEGHNRRIVEMEADSVHQAKLLTRFRHTLLRVNDRIEDEGDRVFFGSTNDADDFREIVQKVDAFGWDQIMDRTKGRDVWAEMRELRQRAEAAEARIAELERERDAVNRIAVDRLYMMEAYRQMLGPKGREVAKLWGERGVLRVHSSWSPEADSLSGEEIAQTHLDTEAAIADAKAFEIDDVDSIRAGNSAIRTALEGR